MRGPANRKKPKAFRFAENHSPERKHSRRGLTGELTSRTDGFTTKDAKSEGGKKIANRNHGSHRRLGAGVAREQRIKPEFNHYLWGSFSFRRKREERSRRAKRACASIKFQLALTARSIGDSQRKNGSDPCAKRSYKQSEWKCHRL